MALKLLCVLPFLVGESSADLVKLLKYAVDKVPSRYTEATIMARGPLVAVIGRQTEPASPELLTRVLERLSVQS